MAQPSVVHVAVMFKKFARELPLGQDSGSPDDPHGIYSTAARFPARTRTAALADAYHSSGYEKMNETNRALALRDGLLRMRRLRHRRTARVTAIVMGLSKASSTAAIEPAHSDGDSLPRLLRIVTICSYSIASLNECHSFNENDAISIEQPLWPEPADTWTT